MVNNNLSKEIAKLDTIEKNNKVSKKNIEEVKRKLASLSAEIQTSSGEIKKERLFGAYNTIDADKLISVIRSLSNQTSVSVKEIANISEITNNNISDLNKMMRILLSISQSIYFDILTNVKTSEDIYEEISNSKSDILRQDGNIKELIQKTIDRAIKDKEKYDSLENRLQKIEQTGLVEKNSKYIIAGFVFLSLIICALSVFIFYKL